MSLADRLAQAQATREPARQRRDPRQRPTASADASRRVEDPFADLKRTVHQRLVSHDRPEAVRREEDPDRAGAAGPRRRCKR